MSEEINSDSDHESDHESVTKIWMNYALDGVPGRQFSGTYGMTDIIPPIIPNPDDDLEEIASPTACFCTGSEDSDFFEFNDIKMIPFYSDQQGCVVWYEGSDGKIYLISGQGIAYCADSKAEFVTRIRIESDLWFKLSKFFGGNCMARMFGRGSLKLMDKEWLENHKEDFSQEEQDYLTYYLDHQDDEQECEGDEDEDEEEGPIQIGMMEQILSMMFGVNSSDSEEE